MSDLERDYTLDVPEESNLQQALDRRLGENRLRIGEWLPHATFGELSAVLQAAWLHNGRVWVGEQDRLPENALGVDLSQRDTVVEVDSVSGLCRAERSATPDSIRKALAQHGQWLPRGYFSSGSDPIGPALESGEAGTLVVALSAVLPDGTMFRTPAAPRRSTGPNPDHAVIGGAGQTGIVTHATLRTRPMPTWKYALRAVGPTPSLINAVRLFLRKESPAFIWLESFGNDDARVTIVPGAQPIETGVLVGGFALEQCPLDGEPIPPVKATRRVGWRALSTFLQSEPCWAGPLDIHGGWVRGPAWTISTENKRHHAIRSILDPSEVLR